MNNDKRKLRELKRIIKRKGHQKRRQSQKFWLKKNPEEAHFYNEYNYGAYTSKALNGIDNDKTKKEKSNYSKDGGKYEEKSQSIPDAYRLFGECADDHTETSTFTEDC